MPDSNRRDFLKTATSAGVSLGLAGPRWQKGGKTSAGRVLGANDRINIGVVGVGGRGSYVSRAFAEYGEKNNNCVQILQVCNMYEKRKRVAAEHFKCDGYAGLAGSGRLATTWTL